MKTAFEKELGEYLYNAFSITANKDYLCVTDIKKIVEKYYKLK